MALIPCPACQKQVSEKAPCCPSCGHPIAAPAHAPAPQKIVVEQQAPRSSGVGCALLILILLIAGGAAVVTKLGEPAMMKAITAKHGAAFLIGAAVGQAIGTAKYQYHDYILFSTVTMEGIGGSQRMLALGLYGQVIVLDP